jgi:1-acyl-sn-glycerol-3-phosphate acyltransferase
VSWLPSSPCGPACLRAVDAVDALPGRAGLRTARLVARLLGVVVVVVVGLGASSLAPVLRAGTTGRVQRRWALALLAASGVRLQRRGPEAPSGALVVGNHVSWLDVLALHAVAPVRMLAKCEVRAWPLLGMMAARVGTVFLDRERLRTLPATVADLAGALREGTTVGVFPEGTTRCGRDLGPFRPAAFQAALDAGAPVVPVALRYRGSTGPATAAFVGDDTLWASVCRVLAARDLRIELTVLPVLDPGAVAAEVARTRPERAAPRRVLAGRSAAAVAAALADRELDRVA